MQSYKFKAKFLPGYSSGQFLICLNCFFCAKAVLNSLINGLKAPVCGRCNWILNFVSRLNMIAWLSLVLNTTVVDSD